MAQVDIVDGILSNVHKSVQVMLYDGEITITPEYDHIWVEPGNGNVVKLEFNKEGIYLSVWKSMTSEDAPVREMFISWRDL